LSRLEGKGVDSLIPTESFLITPQCLQLNATAGGPLYTSTTSHAKFGITLLNVLRLLAKSEFSRL
jgi:hypothetical protein